MTQSEGMLRSTAYKLKIFFKQICSISVIDSHLFIYILGCKIRKKLKTTPKTVSVNTFGLNTDTRETRIIASLTSFPQRIGYVHNTISTLLSQTVKPDVLVLWLASEQFPNKEQDLPDTLLRLKEFGLTIAWCEDLRSYKKLIPALKEYPEDIIITFDDDIYYPQNTIELLYNSYKQEPQSIHTNRARKLYLKNNELYSCSLGETMWGNNQKSSYLNKITGCGGVLYPPHSLNDLVFDENLFKALIPTQDDVWFWAMAVLNHTKIKIAANYNIQLITVDDTQDVGLSKINARNNTGMDSLDASRLIAREFSEIIEIIKESK